VRKNSASGPDHAEEKAAHGPIAAAIPSLERRVAKSRIQIEYRLVLSVSSRMPATMHARKGPAGCTAMSGRFAVGTFITHPPVTR